MTLLTHFNTHQASYDQELLESLVVEYIQMFGQEIVYLPRRTTLDPIYHDDDSITRFDTAYPIEMYIKSINGFGGDRIFMSKYDIEIRDQMVFSIARRRFQLEIGAPEEIDAPREGDLIYFPMNKKLFQIMFSENKPFFYQLGNLQMFDITCEVFEFGSEVFSVGIPEIDSIGASHTQDLLEYAIRDADDNFIISADGWYLTGDELTSKVSDDLSDDTSDIVETLEDEGIVDWSESNPYSLTNPY